MGGLIAIVSIKVKVCSKVNCKTAQVYILRAKIVALINERNGTIFLVFCQ